MSTNWVSNTLRSFVAFLGFGVALYAARHALLGEAAFQGPLKSSFLERPWLIGMHAGSAAIALTLALTQMSRTIRLRWPIIHRWIGRIVMPATLISGGAGLLLAPYSHGGLITHLGFGALAIVTIICPILGWRAIRAKNIGSHREWMLRTFLLLFAAVTLRIELPILTILFGAFLPAYQIVAWLCWVPNLLLAEYLIVRSRSAT